MTKKGILRILTVIFLLLGIFFPTWNRLIQSNGQKPEILVDISQSFDPTVASELTARAKVLAGDGATVSYFADKSPDQGGIDRTRTNLEQAIPLVPQKDIILVTDGWENRGSVASILAKLKEKNIRVFPLVKSETEIKTKSRCDISQFWAPLQAARLTAVPISVTIRNEWSKQCEGTLVIQHGDKEILNRHVIITAQTEQKFDAMTDGNQEGLKNLTAIFIPDTAPLPTTASKRTRFISTTEREKILVISGTDLDNRALRPILDNQNFRAEYQVGTAKNVDTKLLSTFASVILNNVAAGQLGNDFLQQLEQYVAHGGGLVTFGGERGYGLGGFRDSPIEKAMPLQSLPPQTEEKRLNVAVQLVLDKSQSMGQESRLDFVKSAAAEVIKSLKPDDYLGVVAFDSQPFVVVPIARMNEIRDQALAQIQNIFPTGSTRMLRALQDAGRLMDRVPAGRKHIIVLTDGRLPDAGPMYLELTKQLRISGITLSAILLTDSEGTYPLKEMSELGGGVFYVTTDPTKLPRIFMEDIKVSTGERTMKEAAEYEIKKGPSGILSTTVAAFPSVKGYVQTKARPNVNLELSVEKPNSGVAAEPLLASWNYEKGKAISFSSDIYGRWTDQWMQWPKFSQFILDIVKSSATQLQKDESIKFDLRPIIQGDTITFDLSVFTPVTIDQAAVVITRPDGSKESIPCAKRSEGSYQAALSSAKSGDYSIVPTINGKALSAISVNIGSEQFGEVSGKGFNYPLLSEIASQTGGRVNPTLITPQTAEEPIFKPIRIDIWFFFLALLSFLAEIFVREGLFRRVAFKRRSE